MRTPRNAVRVGIPDGCPEGGARPGHYHRRVADPFQDQASGLCADRCSRASRVHQEHGDRRRSGRRRGARGRRHGRHPGTDPASRVSSSPARHSTGGGGGQQDGPGGVLRGAVPRGRRRRQGLSRRPGHRPSAYLGHSGFVSGRRRHRPPLRPHAVVRGRHVDRGAGHASAAGYVRAASAAVPDTGCLQVRPTADSGRPDRKRTSQRGRYPAVLSVQQDRPGDDHRSLEREGSHRRRARGAVGRSYPGRAVVHRTGRDGEHGHQRAHALQRLSRAGFLARAANPSLPAGATK